MAIYRQTEAHLFRYNKEDNSCTFITKETFKGAQFDGHEQATIGYNSKLIGTKFKTESDFIKATSASSESDYERQYRLVMLRIAEFNNKTYHA